MLYLLHYALVFIILGAGIFFLLSHGNLTKIFPPIKAMTFKINGYILIGLSLLGAVGTFGLGEFIVLPFLILSSYYLASLSLFIGITIYKHK